jgi:hypothetical protein
MIIGYLLRWNIIQPIIWLHKYGLFSFKNQIWKDKKNNTLMHYAALYQRQDLLEFASHQKYDLNLLNKEGKAPLHIFIESCFYTLKKKEKNTKEQIVYKCDFEMFNFFLKNTPNINQLMEFPKRKELGWDPLDIGSFSKSNILGSPLELLILFFWDFVYYKEIEQNSDYFMIYYKMYKMLRDCGAEINKLGESKPIEDKIHDAMQDQNIRIGSIFFFKFLTKEIDYFVLKPILEDEQLDFLITEEGKNTILHTICGKITRNIVSLQHSLIEKIIFSVVNNKNFSPEALDVKNNFNMVPTQCLKKEAQKYKTYFEASILKTKLMNALTKKEDIKIKSNKI